MSKKCIVALAVAVAIVLALAVVLGVPQYRVYQAHAQARAMQIETDAELKRMQRLAPALGGTPQYLQWLAVRRATSVQVSTP